MPEIVVRELVNQFLVEVPSARDRLNTALRELDRYLGRDLPRPVVDAEVGSACDNYDQWLRARLTSLGVRVEPVPASLGNVDILVRRDLDRRKPFDDRRDRRSGRRDRSGMRDALIWESVLELCRREPRSLVFISDNTNDFGNTPGDQLHEHLLDDLAAVGIRRDYVKLLRTVRQFNETYLAHQRTVAPAGSTGSSAEQAEPTQDDDESAERLTNFDS